MLIICRFAKQKNRVGGLVGVTQWRGPVQYSMEPLKIPYRVSDEPDLHFFNSIAALERFCFEYIQF